MSASIRVFAILADSQLRKQVQRQWHANGVSLCALHAEYCDSLIEAVARLRPDVIVADAEIADVGDFVRTAATRFRVPVVAVVRGERGNVTALRPLEWGAIDLVARNDQSIESLVGELDAAVHTVREAQVVELLESVFPLSGAFPDAAVFDLRRALRDMPTSEKAVVLGAGLGGPMAVRRILQALRGGECSPVIYVQRIADTLVPALVEWLERHTGVRTQRAVHGQTLDVGHVYVAGAREGIKVGRRGTQTILTVSPPNGNGKPMDTLMTSVANTYRNGAVGVLLSDHGDDGCEGMQTMRAAGGLTITQDRASSLVYELPGRVRERGGAIECLPINEIAERIRMLMPSKQAASV